MQVIRVAILGAGFMGQQHSQRLAATDGVEIVSICARPIEGADELAAGLACDGIATYDDFDAMLDAGGFDALYVCIPPFAHNGEVERAAARGIHLFLEKPLALTLDRAESMVAAAEAAGVVTQVGYHMRFGKSVQRMKALLDSGQAGRPTQFQARYWTNMDGNSWWRFRDRSGGQLCEQVIHLYDLAMSFLGEPQRAGGYVANLCHRQREDYTIEDTSVGTVVFRKRRGRVDLRQQLRPARCTSSATSVSSASMPCSTTGRLDRPG